MDAVVVNADIKKAALPMPNPKATMNGNNVWIKFMYQSLNMWAIEIVNILPV